jgi:FAD-dependent oxidoreductase domain-containing protein 1
MRRATYDVLLVGGGIMGCATAYYLLKADARLKVAILEKDPSYAHSSTLLSDGNTRLQFNVKENIQMSIYGLEVLARFAEEMAVDGERPDVAFRQQGNLFLVDEESRPEAEHGLALQQSLGCQVDWLDPEEVARRYPLYNLTGSVGGTFGPLDGTLDPTALLMAYKNNAISLGASFIQAEVFELITEQNRITGVRLTSGKRLLAGNVVNAAGAWAPALAQTAGIDLPVQPVKRQVFVFESNARPEGILPALFFPSGLYLMHEHGGQFMCGKSLADDPVGYEFGWNRELFTERLWPELVAHIPAFDRLKLASGWAGLYAVNTLDGNAILGEWPGLKGAYLANGFSGHGFQQCHAVGRYLAELILGQPPTLDLSIFSPQRILENKPVFESQRRLI